MSSEGARGEERMGGASPLLGSEAIRKGGEGNQPTMISHGVEISIAGGVEEMVRGPPIRSLTRYLYLDHPPTLTLVTHHAFFPNGHDPY